MTASEHGREARERTARTARNAARGAAIDLALQEGAEIIGRPAFRGSQISMRDVEPLAGLRAAREIEVGARHHVRNYIRDAREAGCTWSGIGAAIDLVPGREPDLAGETVAEAAYSYAVGRPDSQTAGRYGRSFSWHCASCDGLITDQGPFDGPVDAERATLAGARGSRRRLRPGRRTGTAGM